ncbi:uncharacterized protein G2W53_030085 [Senna tora]|uniref:Uncharacterized protein n=1 Tax=Senna tora TaxID=362788 RepID=A0A834T6U1_9FABA|nr:uncharacterized protein G2W53_030085 [Senna tora]
MGVILVEKHGIIVSWGVYHWRVREA